MNTLQQNQPLLHLYQPIMRDGKWFGHLAVNLGGRTVEILAKADQDLIEKLYRFASSIVQFGPEKGAAMAGVRFAGMADAPELPLADGASIARESAFGRMLSDVADALPDPMVFTDDMRQALAALAIDAGQNDDSQAWADIYGLSCDARAGDSASIAWATALRDLVLSVSRGGVAMGAALGPSLFATLSSHNNRRR